MRPLSSDITDDMDPQSLRTALLSAGDGVNRTQFRRLARSPYCTCLTPNHSFVLGLLCSQPQSMTGSWGSWMRGSTAACGEPADRSVSSRLRLPTGRAVMRLLVGLLAILALGASIALFERLPTQFNPTPSNSFLSSTSALQRLHRCGSNLMLVPVFVFRRPIMTGCNINSFLQMA